MIRCREGNGKATMSTLQLAEFPGLCSRLIIATASPKHDLTVHATLPKPLEFGLLIATVEACVKK
jgi:hypothetical protein